MGLAGNVDIASDGLELLWNDPQVGGFTKIITAANQAKSLYSLANGPIYASDYGIVADTGADQRTAILNMIADLTTNQYGGVIIFPAGVISFTGPIDWSGCGKPGRFYYQAADSFITPPTIQGAGAGITKFKLLNPANTNVTGFTFSITTAQAGAGITRVVSPNIRDCDFIGPGQFITHATLSSDAVVGTSVVITTAVAAIGDAVCLMSGARRHWATVINVSGAGPQTLTLDVRQAILTTFPSASSQVILFKQSRLIQFGGTRTAASTIVQEVKLSRVRCYSAFQGICFDDTTIINGEYLVFQNVQHDISFGFNVDTLTLEVPYSGTDRPNLQNAVCTNGTRTITAESAAAAASISVGEKIWELANADGTLNFPEHTYVESVVGTTITVSQNYVGTTGAKTLYVCCGVLIVNGQGGTAFLPAYSGNTLNNFTEIVMNNPITGRIECLMDSCDTVGQGVTITGGYAESVQRVIRNGQLGGSGAGGTFVLTNYWIQDADKCIGPAIDDFLGGAARFDIRIASLGSAKFPMLQSRANNCVVRIREGWSWVNTSTAAKSYLQTVPAIINLSTTDPNTALALTAGTEWSYNVGHFGKVDGNGAAIVNSSFSGALNWNWPGISILDLTLTGNLTAGSIIYGMAPRGYEITLFLKQDATGGRTVTLGASFLKGDGTSLGTIAAGTSNQSLILTFVSNGTSLLLQGSQTPVFVA